MEALEDRSMPSSYFWKGAVDGNWSDLNNWTTTLGGGTAPGALPGAADDLIFDSANNPALFSSTNNIGAFAVNSLQVVDNDSAAGRDFTIAGRAGNILTVNSAISNAGSDTTSTTTLVLSMTGAAGLTQSSTGVLVLGGINSYSGATNINAGTLRVGDAPVPAGASGIYTFDNVAGTTVVNDGSLGAPANATRVSNAAIATGLKGNGLTVPDQTSLLNINNAITNAGGVYTASAWFNGLYGSGSWRTLFRGSDAAGTGDHHVIIENANFRLGFYGNSAGGGFSPVSPTYNVQTNNIETGWHNITVVANGTNTTFYVDGVSVGAVNRVSTRDIKSIGNYLTGTQAFAQLLDEVYVYNSALSAGQVQQLVDAALLGNGIPDASPVNVAGGAILDLNGVNETVGPLSGGGNVTLGAATLTVNSTAPSSYSGSISGSGGLTKTNSGTLTLLGTNTYNGTTTIAGGLQLGNGGTTGALGTNAIVNNGNLAFNRSDAIAVSNTISGSGSVSQIGSGTVTLSAGNSYTGDTTVASGVLVAAHGNALGTSTGITSVLSGATLAFAGNITIAGEHFVVDGNGAPGQSGVLVNQSGANTLGGGVQAQLVPGGQITLASLAGSLTINAAVALQTSNLVTNGAGDLVFNGAIVGGEINLTNLDNFPTGDYVLTADGQTFIAHVDHDGTRSWLLVGRGRQGWTFASTGQGANDQVRTGLGTPAAFSPAYYSDAIVNDILAQGSITLPSVEARLRRAAAANGSAYQEGRLRNFSVPDWTWVFANPGTDVSSGGYTGLTEQLFPSPLNGAVTLANVNSRDTNPPAGNDATRIFTWAWGGHASQRGFSYGSSVNLVAGPSATNYLWESGGENHEIPYTEVYIRDQTAVPTATTNTITKNGGGLVAFNAANRYSGTTTVNAGTLRVAGGSALPDTGAVILNGTAVLDVQASETIGSLSSPSASTSVLLAGATLTTGDASDTAFAGVISGTGGLTKAGSGTFTLGNVNTYAGTTTISQGVLAMGAVDSLPHGPGTGDIVLGSTLDLNGFSTTINGLTGTAPITNTGAAAVTLSFGDNNASSSVGGPITNTGGALSINKIGTGTYTLTGPNSFTGNITVTAGILTASGALAPAGATGIFTFDNVAGTTINNEGAGGGVRNGVLVGGAAIAGGIRGNAMSVPGQSAMMQITNTITHTDGIYTMSAWFNTLYSSMSWRTLFRGLDNVPTSGAGDHHVIINSGGTSLGMYGNSAGGGFTPLIPPYDVAANGITTGWHNLTVVANGSVSTFYIDGVAIGTMNKVSAKNVYAVGNFNGGGQAFAELIDEVYIYNSALNAAQVQQLYQATLTHNVIPDGAVVNVAAAGTLNVSNVETFGGFSGSGNVILNSDTTVNQAADMTFSGTITGAASLTKQGATNFTLDGDSPSYTGAVAISAGTVSVGSGGGTGSIGTGDIDNDGSLVFNRTGSVAVPGNISGSGTLTLNSAPTVILTGVNTYTGQTSINGGSLQLANAGGQALADTGAVVITGSGNLTVQTAETIGSLASASGAATLTLNATLTAGDSADAAFAGNISGPGGYTKTGAGTMTFLGTNTYGGTTTISGGLQLGNGGTTGSLGTGAVVNNGSLVFNRSNAAAVPNAISGTGSVSQVGTGTVALSGGNSYTGVTSVDSGVLVAANDTALGTAAGSTNVLDGATLAFAGDITMAGEIIVVDGNGAPGQLGVLVNQSGNNTLASGFVLAQLVPGGQVTFASLAGTLTINSTVNLQTSDLVIDGAGDIVINGAIVGGTINLSNLDSFPTGDYVMTADSQSFVVHVDNDGTHSWLLIGRGRQGWTFSSAGQGTNDQVNSGLGTPAAFSPAYYSDAIVNDILAQSSITLPSVETRLRRAAAANGSAYQEGRLRNFSVPNWTWVFADPGSGVVSGGYTGLTEQLFASPLNGPVTLNNVNSRDTLPPAGNDATRIFTWAWSGHANQRGFSYGSSVNLVAGPSAGNFLWESGSENHEIPYTEVYIRSQTSAPSSTINNITKIGSGVFTLSGNNNYAGTTTVNDGTLRVDAPGGDALPDDGPVVINGSGVLDVRTDETIGSLASASAASSAVLDATLTTGDASDTTFAGVISGAGGLTKAGSSTFTLTGTNTYDLTTISAGALQIGNGGTTGSLGTGDVVNNSSLVFNRSNALAVPNAISGPGTLSQIGTGAVTLSGGNSYTGDTNINTGVLVAANDTALGTAAGSTTVQNGATLAFAGDINLAGEIIVVDGDGAPGQLGALVNHSGNNTVGGGFVLAQLVSGGQVAFASLAGTLTIDSKVTLQTSNLVVDGPGDIVINGAIVGGPLTLSNLDSFPTGDYALSAGGQTFSVHIDNDGTRSWLLVGRGREGWTFSSAGQGTNAQVNSGLGTPAAFSPAYYSDAIVNDILAQSSIGLPSVETRLRRAAAANGSVYQEGRLRNFTVADWTWVFANPGSGVVSGGYTGLTEQLFASPINGAVTHANVNSRDTNPPAGNDATRIFTWAWSGHANQRGFSYGSSVNLVSGPSATNFLWEAGTENHEIPYTEVYIRSQTAVQSPTTNNITKNGAGVLTLGANNLFSGTTTVGGGTLRVNAPDNALPNSGAVVVNGAGIFDVQTNERIGSLASASASSSTVLSATLTTGDASDTSFAGVISGTSGLTKVGSGTFTLANSNTYAGTTMISQGVLAMGAVDALPHGPGTGDIVLNSTLDLNGYDTTINGLFGISPVTNTAPAPVTFSVGDNDANSFVAGVITNTGGALSLNKIGTGTYTMMGANSFTGNINVAAGTLAAAGAQAPAGATGIYTFDNVSGATVANDGSGGAVRSGTFIGSAATAAGIRGNAMSVPTQTGMMQIANPITHTNGIYTVSAWFNDLYDQASWRTLFRGLDNVPTSGAGDHHVIINSGGTSLGMFGNSAGGGFTALTPAYDVLVNGITTGWHNLTVVANGTTSTFYIDGFQIGTMNKVSAKNVYAVGNIQGGGQAFAKFIDEVYIYNSALTAVEVQQLYQATLTNNVIPDGAVVNVESAGTLDVSNVETFGGLSGTGSAILNSDTTLATATDLTFAGALSGGSALMKTGAASFTLSGDNSAYTGEITISNGVLAAGSDNALGSPGAGTTVQSGGTLGFSGDAVIASEPVTASGSGFDNLGVLRNLSGENSLSGPVTVNVATAAVTLQNGTASFSQTNFSPAAMIDGVTTMSAGGWANSGNAAGSTAVFETASNLNPTGQSTLLSFSILSGGYTNHTIGKFKLYVTTDDRANFADGLANGGQIGSNWIELTPLSAVATGGAILTIGGDNSILASGPVGDPNTYTIRAVTNLANITGVRIDTLKDPSLPAQGPGRASNGNYVIVEWNVAATPLPPIVLGSDAGNLTLGGTLDAAPAQQGLSKVGAGSVTLAGTNNYAGPTSVDGGALLVDSVLNASALGGVTVNNTGLLGGSGTINQNVVVRTGATLAPGNSAGTLTVGGNVTFEAGSFFSVEINGPVPGTEYDQLVVSGAGNVAIDPGAYITGSTGYQPVNGTTYLVLNKTSSGTTTGVFTSYDDFPVGGSPGVVNIGGKTYSTNYAAPSSPPPGGNQSLLLTAVQATRVWDGGGTTDNWSDAGNWDGDNINDKPFEGDHIVFNNSSRLNSVKDAALAAVVFDTLTIANTAGDYVITGGTANFTGGISASNSGSTNTLGIDLFGSAGLTMSGTGALVLTGTNTYSGTTAISSGSLFVDGSTTSATTVAASTTLGGSGTITGNVSGAGEVAPGAAGGGVGTLTVNGTFAIGSLVFDVNAPYAAGEVDQIAVNGIIDLTGTSLTFSGTGGTAPPLPSFITLIANDLGDTITTTGATPADGSLVTIGGTQFRLFYNGGSGNDTILVANVSPTVAYVSPTWSTLTPGTFIADADFGTAGAQPAIYGVDAFTGVNAALTAIPASGQVIVNSGVYAEAVALTSTRTFTVTSGAAATVDSYSSVAGAATQVNLGAVFTFGDAADTSIDAVSGAGTLAKQGAGAVILGAANTYTGGTSISGGTLIVNGSLASGTVAVSSGTLAGSGTIGGSVIATGSGRVSPGTDTTIADLTIAGDLSLLGSSTLYIEINGLVSWDTVTVGGMVTINAPGATISGQTLAAQPVGSPAFTVIDGGTNFTGTFLNATAQPTVAIGVRNYTYLYTGPTAYDFQLASAPSDVEWDGGGPDNRWTTGLNWVGDSAPTFGDNVVFGNIGLGNPGNLLSLNDFAASTVFGIKITNTSGAYTLTGNAITLGSAGLTESGAGGAAAVSIALGGASGVSVTAGALTLSGANTYAGDTSITGGSLALGASDVIPDGASAGDVLVNGTLDMAGFTDTINALAGSGIVDNSAGSGLLIAGNTDANSTFSGVLRNTGGTLSLTKIGAGTLTLSGAAANTATGTTTVTDGVLALAKTGAVSVAGTVVIGDGDNNAQPANVKTAILRVDASEQIANAAGISFVGNDGRLLIPSGVTETLATPTDFAQGEVKIAGLLITTNAYAQPSGTTTLNGGTLRVGTAGTENSSLGTQAAPGAMLQGSGTIYTNILTTWGTIDPSSGITDADFGNASPGRITIRGNLQMTGASVTNLDVGNAGSDQLNVGINPALALPAGSYTDAANYDLDPYLRGDVASVTEPSRRGVNDIHNVNGTVRFHGTLNTRPIGGGLVNNVSYGNSMNFVWRALDLPMNGDYPDLDPRGANLSSVPSDFQWKNSLDAGGLPAVATRFDPRFMGSGGQFNAVGQSVATMTKFAGVNTAVLTAPAYNVGQAKALTLTSLTSSAVPDTTVVKVTKQLWNAKKDSHTRVTLTITNTSAAAVAGPIYVEVVGMPSGATVFNAAGKRSTNKPYLVVPAASLAGGASVTMEVDLLTPLTLGKFSSLTLQVLRGGMP